MSGRSLRALFSVLAIAAASAAPFAQNAPQHTPPLFQSGVDLVNVDIAVIDKAGRPIRGLTKNDFTIRGQTITTFQEISSEFSSDPAQAAGIRLGLSRQSGRARRPHTELPGTVSPRRCVFSAC